ncbi:hypothetical protein F4780DRAFT_782778 [Xylariomycetidae sp. FL0641]|nr:hypothetical protein F4780DRAFT_782778 [Xylariomycetidae sp. FL0641]
MVLVCFSHGGLPVLSSPFSNLEDDRRNHLQALSKLLASHSQRSGPTSTKSTSAPQPATKEAFTGDQGVTGSDGNLSLVGRAKDVIDINGIKVVTADIQTAVEQAVGDLMERLVVFPSLASRPSK